MTASGVDCELCGTPTVHRVGESPAGVEEWRCATCGDFKRWCPECNQGWIRRFRLTATEAELYSCDECEAAWPSAAEIRVPGASRRSLLRRLGTTEGVRLEVLRERRPEPPAP